MGGDFTADEKASVSLPNFNIRNPEFAKKKKKNKENKKKKNNRKEPWIDWIPCDKGQLLITSIDW